MSVFSDPGKFYNADPFTFLLASFLVFIFGAGFFSLDPLVRSRVSRHTPAVGSKVTANPIAA